MLNAAFYGIVKCLCPGLGLDFRTIASITLYKTKLFLNPCVRVEISLTKHSIQFTNPKSDFFTSHKVCFTINGFPSRCDTTL